MLYRIVKRTIDVILSTVLWILASPLMLMISILIKLSDGGEVFVGTPVRYGLEGKHFFMYKFRTMIPNAHDLTMGDSKKRDELLSNHKLKGDSRVTRVGRVLRGTDLDELPQLINVLLGHMSMVGPRPFYSEEIEHHLKEYPEDEKYFKNIFKVKPGITGIWQVSGRNEIPFRERLRMESEYALNPSIIKDVYILLQTPWVVISRKGVTD
ncbi:MAG: sugar transferase [Candidatus Dojkabacteria bacterium]|jgi:lipopolysaccharide/colanic/teichoic acid biosynthesis glycosyltransferase|nr:sugar transferase [Candidatus Dojkabacteria bacterium]